MANQVTIRMQVAIGFAAMAATIAMVGVPEAPAARGAAPAMAATGCTPALTPVDPPTGSAEAPGRCRARPQA